MADKDDAIANGVQAVADRPMPPTPIGYVVNLTQTTWAGYGNLSSTIAPAADGAFPPLWLKQFYMIFVPILVGVCLIGMMANACVLLTLRWIRGNISATLRLTVSLAVSDVYTSALLAFSFVYNSYLWTVHGVSTSACVALTSEALRTGGLLTSTFHFFVLAVNHYLSTAHPFVYKKILSPSTTGVVILLLWLLPPIALLICFASVPGQGYQTPNGTCKMHFFMHTLTFRLTIFTIIATLLIAMSALYVSVIVILRRMRQRFAQKKSSAGVNNERQQQQLQRKRNTLITTLLIWGTFFGVWFPTAVIFVLSCDTCPYSRFKRFDNSGVFWVSIIAQVVILTKTLINPIIYAVRIPEISEVLLRQFYPKCCCYSKTNKNKNGNNNNNGDTTDHLRSVRYRKTDDEQTVVLLTSSTNLHTVTR